MNGCETPGAFRGALEERIRQRAKSGGVDLNRTRRQLTFDRLLARFIQNKDALWALKGGYALELQFKAARSTVDIYLPCSELSFPTMYVPRFNENEKVAHLNVLA